MPLVIWGTKSRAIPDSTGFSANTTCGKCGQLVLLEPIRIKKYFSLFWIPLIPLGEGDPGLRCPSCDAMYHRQKQ